MVPHTLRIKRFIRVKVSKLYEYTLFQYFFYFFPLSVPLIEKLNKAFRHNLSIMYVQGYATFSWITEHLFGHLFICYVVKFLTIVFPSWIPVFLLMTVSVSFVLITKTYFNQKVNRHDVYNNSLYSVCKTSLPQRKRFRTFEFFEVVPTFFTILHFLTPLNCDIPIFGLKIFNKTKFLTITYELSTHNWTGTDK